MMIWRRCGGWKKLLSSSFCEQKEPQNFYCSLPLAYGNEFSKDFCCFFPKKQRFPAYGETLTPASRINPSGTWLNPFNPAFIATIFLAV